MGLFDIFSDDNERAAADAKISGYNTGLTNANTALDNGFKTATGYYDKALVPFNDLLTRGNKGYDTYLDATGVNGAEGIARAGDLYKSLPGYSAGQTTGLDLLERRAAARGDLGGGNTSADTIKFASDYDAGKYKDFISSLAPNIGVATGATSGTAGILGQEGNLAATTGAQKAGYGYQAATGVGNANADFENSKDQTSANFWSALIGGAKLAAGAFGGGIPGLGGSAGGLGLGSGSTATTTGRLY